MYQKINLWGRGTRGISYFAKNILLEPKFTPKHIERQNTEPNHFLGVNIEPLPNDPRAFTPRRGINLLTIVPITRAPIKPKGTTLRKDLRVTSPNSLKTKTPTLLNDSLRGS